MRLCQMWTARVKDYFSNFKQSGQTNASSFERIGLLLAVHGDALLSFLN